MADCAPTFQPGEIVDITIRGVRVVEARSDGSVTINAKTRDGGPASWRMPPQAKVERVASSTGGAAVSADKRCTITPAADSRLAQLAELYAQAKTAADAAAERLKTVSDAIKAELREAAPGADSITLAGPVPLRLTERSSWRVDVKKLKAEDPLTYAQYAKKSTSWSLTTVKP